MILRKLWQRVDQSERRLIFWMSVLLITITGVPYLYAALAAPTGYFYSGISSLTPADNPVYFSYIRQMSSGSFLLFDKFTSEPQAVGLFNVIWLAVGALARAFQLGPVAAFHAARLLSIPPFLLLAYLFGCLFFDEPRWRKQFLLWLCFASGLGVYLAVPWYVLAPAAPPHWSPPDVWVPEAVTFLTVYKTPHFIASLGGMLGIFLLMLVGWQEKKVRYVAAAGLVGLALFNFHPFYAPTVVSTLGLTVLLLSWQRGRLAWAEAGYAAIVVAISSPSLLYHFWALRADPILAGRALQNYLPAPPLIFLLFGYGLLWVLAGIGIFHLTRRRQWSLPFFLLASLGITCLALIFLPTYFQNRYTEGLHVVLVMFSVAALKALSEQARPPAWYRWLAVNRYLAVVAFVALLGMSNVFVVARDLYYFTVRPEGTLKIFYLPNGLRTVLGRLDDEPAGSVLADPVLSLSIPVFSDHPAFVAHSIETIDYPAKLTLAAWVLANDRQSAGKESVLRRHGISYLLFDRKPKAGSFDPATKPYLRLLAQDGDVRLFTFTPEVKE